MKYGGVVTDTDGKRWDWGQAICRVLYGPRWSSHPEFLRVDDIDISEPAPQEAIELIEAWENGDWPECIMEVKEHAVEK